MTKRSVDAQTGSEEGTALGREPLSAEQMDPSESDRKRGIALALSGGGFRAALFHLGVITYLRETGLLVRVKTVASVSGGSIVAAHLAANWHNYTGGSFADTCKPLLSAIGMGFRGERDFGNPAERFRRFLSDKLFSASGTPSKLLFLREGPELAILATDTRRVKRVYFNRSGGHAVPLTSDLLPSNPEAVATENLDITSAVAASACFPWYFQAIRFSARANDPRAARTEDILCHDGGIFDNTGLQHLHELTDDFELVLLSDAGKALSRAEADSVSGMLSGGIRSMIVGMDSTREYVIPQARRKWGDRLVPIDIRAKSLDEAGERGYTGDVAIRIAEIRTDLDSFSDDERRILLHHGYQSARRALNQRS